MEKGGELEEAGRASEGSPEENALVWESMGEGRGNKLEPVEREVGRPEPMEEKL